MVDDMLLNSEVTKFTFLYIDTVLNVLVRVEDIYRKQLVLKGGLNI